MPMNAGDLNRRITIQQRAEGRDSIGQPLDGWEDVAHVWANIRTQTGIGVMTGMQGGDIPASIERYSIRIRYRQGITAGMRVLYQGQAYDIRQIRMDFAGREWTDLICELGGNEG